MNAREAQIARALEAPCVKCGRHSPLGEHECRATGVEMVTVDGKQFRIDHDAINKAHDAAMDNVAANITKSAEAMAGFGVKAKDAAAVLRRSHAAMVSVGGKTFESNVSYDMLP